MATKWRSFHRLAAGDYDDVNVCVTLSRAFSTRTRGADESAFLLQNIKHTQTTTFKINTQECDSCSESSARTRSARVETEQQQQQREEEEAAAVEEAASFGSARCAVVVKTTTSVWGNPSTVSRRLRREEARKRRRRRRGRRDFRPPLSLLLLLLLRRRLSRVYRR